MNGNDTVFNSTVGEQSKIKFVIRIPFSRRARMKEASNALLCCISPLEMEGIASAG